MSGSLTGPTIGTRKWNKLENVPDLSDGSYDSQAPFFSILVDMLMDKEREKSIFVSFPKFSHTC